MNSIARFLGKGKLPRSYRPGKLLSLIERDLPQHQLELNATARGRFTGQGGGLPSFNVHEEVIKNFLGHITVVVFGFELAARPGSPGRALIRNTGSLRKTGLEAIIKEGDEAFADAADRLVSDKRFADALMELDFKHYRLYRKEDVWRAETDLMGASEVITAFPPARRYIRLYPDQRHALLESFRAMEQALG